MNPVIGGMIVLLCGLVIHGVIIGAIVECAVNGGAWYEWAGFLTMLLILILVDIGIATGGVR